MGAEIDLLPFFCPLFSALIHKVLEDGQGIHTVFRVGDRTGHTLRMPLDAQDRTLWGVQTLGDAVEREHADVDDQQDNEQGGKQDLAALLNALLDAAEADQGGQDDNGENDGIDQGAVCVNLVVVPLNVVQERSAADGGTMYTAQMAMTTG